MVQSSHTHTHTHTHTYIHIHTHTHTSPPCNDYTSCSVPRIFTTRWADLSQKEFDFHILGRSATSPVCGCAGSDPQKAVCIHTTRDVWSCSNKSSWVWNEFVGVKWVRGCEWRSLDMWYEETGGHVPTRDARTYAYLCVDQLCGGKLDNFKLKRAASCHLAIYESICINT